MDTRKPIRIGLLGAGVVGVGVYELLRDNADWHRDVLGLDFSIVSVGCKDRSKPRPIPTELLTTELADIVSNPQIDLILEATGDVEAVHGALALAIEAGKGIVTANKALMAQHGGPLLKKAAAKGVDVRYEACVCAGTPVVGSLLRLTAANRPIQIRGILNGSTNMMLTLMSKSGWSYEEALKECQSLGYLEADPTSDVDGFDACYKLAILASVITRTHVRPESIQREGIRGITIGDLEDAKKANRTIKLIGSATFEARQAVCKVAPQAIPNEDFLAEISHATNAVLFEGDPLGMVAWIGPGAGAGPTASALVSDMIDIAQQWKLGSQPVAIPWA